jgi:hypothetical protein
MGVTLWVRKLNRTHYEAWFKNERDYLKATGQPIP